MARIKLSPIISSINGKLGNAVFQGGKSGIILREKVKPRNLNTPRQVQARNRISTVKATWQNLNESQRNSWIGFAAFYKKKTKNNSTKTLSAYELFIQHNTVRVQGNYDILETTTFELTTLQLTEVAVSIALVGQITIKVDMVPEDFIDNVAMYISKPFRQSANIAQSEVRYVATSKAFDNALNITDIYLSLFGRLPQVGEKVLVKAIGFKDLSGWTSKPNFQEKTL
jgi:hypothetical protein